MVGAGARCAVDDVDDGNRVSCDVVDLVSADDDVVADIDSSDVADVLAGTDVDDPDDTSLRSLDT
jgi:hypothetical protein